MNKIQRYFPHVEKLLPLIDFCRNTLNFSERVIQELGKLKKVRLKGDFYSPEFNRKFRDENAAFSFEEDKNRKGDYHICMNDIPLVQWFRQKAHEWRIGLGIAPTRQDKGLKIQDELKNPFQKQIKVLEGRRLSQKVPIFAIRQRKLFPAEDETLI